MTARHTTSAMITPTLWASVEKEQEGAVTGPCSQTGGKQASAAVDPNLSDSDFAWEELTQLPSLAWLTTWLTLQSLACRTITRGTSQTISKRWTKMGC